MVRKFVIIAGEQSGDNLAASLILALKQHYPDAKFFGVAGPKMKKAGCHAWFDVNQLAVMGIIEVIKHLPRLLKLKKQLLQQITKLQPECYIGIDAPDFNLPIEKKLKNIGIKTIHYVSPSIWAWRSGRINTIKKAVDLMLLLFPFEQKIYQENNVNAQFVGHPLADQYSLQFDKADIKKELGYDQSTTLLALLPGSRIGEVSRMLPLQLSAVEIMQLKINDFAVIIPCANNKVYQLIKQVCQERHMSEIVKLTSDNANKIMAAADVGIVTSGTATLEGLFVKMPMVIIYQLNRMSSLLLKLVGGLQVDYVGLPNLLANKMLVPELIQHNATPQKIAQAAMNLMQNPQDELLEQYELIHQSLKLGASEQAALAVKALLDK